MRAQDSEKAQDRANPRVPVPRIAAAPPDLATLSRSSGLTPGDVTALQRTAGNRAVSRALQREAHRHGAGCGHGTQTTEEATGAAVRSVLGSRGRSLPASVQRDAEARLGTPAGTYSAVQIHDGPKDIEVSRALGAVAFTSGSDIVGDVSQPQTLFHELHHVVQQQRGAVPGTDMGNGLKVSDENDHAEREAAEVGARAAAASPVQRATDAQAAGTSGTVAGGHVPVRRAAVVQRARGGAQDTAPARMDGDRLLDVIVGQNRTLGGFPFGSASRNNGGNNLISRPVEVRVQHGTTTAVLAVHLNVMLTTGGEVVDRRNGSSSVSIYGEKAHLTARLADNQSSIEQNGASILTAGESIHVGRSNADKGWGNNPVTTRALADKAGIPAEQLLAALQNRFPPANIAGIIDQFKKDVGRVVIHALLPEVVTVNWEGDKSFD
ncbi:DUF4157 domain-containing protein [Streptomyces althioticus]|jgi:hypothetical protein|uniref:DUF4157 domain-containing protein n=1 Tax=Streptomyces althioticus TaxID=83380 RepID=A0ABZ1YBT3_9ACTN|nr:DUF4157 domain-containing protein [Streptomyces althioticus]WTB98003.1 DUF4157 domain-containing protein [Streptomyces althioticus]GGQ67410.1 hypothetical protein GCM10010267_33100 [Streptomyces griseorubens]